MTHRSSTLFWVVSTALLCLVTRPAAAQGSPAGFAETFALAVDRSAVLEQLIPGTDEHYYYTCLQLQHAGRTDGVKAVLDVWLERHGRTQRLRQIQNRQALLTYGDNPAASLEHIRRELGLAFNDAQQVAGDTPDLPTRLDPARISHETLSQRAMARSSNLSGFTDQGLETLAGAPLDAERLRHFLERLPRPDVANLPALVARDLDNPRSGGFGSVGIHSKMLLDQLEQCARLRPAILNDTEFVTAYLRRLVPSADIAWQTDPAQRAIYLDTLYAFAQRLAPAHNSLKAHVLYHRLRHDLAEGVAGDAANRARFMEYLRLPRQGHYIHPEYVRRAGRGGALVDHNQTYPTALDRVGDDEALVRTYLARFLVAEDTPAAYSDYLKPDYLRTLFAETKILAGVGDMERWYSLLGDPARYEALKQRVDIDFAPEQPTRFAADEAVQLAIDVKNAPMLLVKVFEINAFEVYRDTGAEVSPGLDVDGLVANVEKTLTFDSPPLRRVRRTLDLPELAQPGVYVVELIGNGLSSRALIRKGALRATAREGSAGHVVTVRNEAGAPLPGATVWFGGREFATDERGEAVIPFSTRPGRRPMILSHGRLSTLDTLDHASESYTLEAGIHVPREALLGGQTAQILVRPVLSLNGQAIAIALLDDPTLTISAVDIDGVAATTDVRDLELSDTADLVHEIPVPKRLVSLSVQLRGKVKSLTAEDPVDVASAPATFDINGIDTTLQTDSALLSRTADGYVVDLRGKNGEAQAARPLQITMRHRDFTETVDATLMTDDAGRVHLGTLEGIEWIVARDARTNHSSQWTLTGSERTVLAVRHARAGDDVLIPYQGRSSTVDRGVLSVLELRSGQFRSDVLAQAVMRPGYVVLQGLAPGDYDVLLKESGDRIRVVVTSGAEHAGWAMGPVRSLDLRERLPLQITEAVFRGDALDVRLAYSRPGTRVHIYTSRYLPAFDPFAHLDAGPLPGLGYTNEADHASSYHSGREIGDEYRYILERRFATKFPGNMLSRPSMHLNPWALPVSVWNSAGETGEDGGADFRGRGGRRQGRGAGEPSLKPKHEGSAPNGFANLDFLGDATLVLANLTPDDEGRLQVPLQQLGSGHLVHVVVVDPSATIYRQLVRREQPLQVADQRLTRALAQGRHFSEQRRIEYLGRGDRIDLTADAAEVATYDSLAAVHQLLFALTNNADLAKFAFVLRWPELSDDEKRALYSEHACHELHFFLHQKDPAFFAAVVRPYLANKAHMSFLDHWLLDADLGGYLEPWQFGRLNAVERILLARRLTGEADSIRRYGDELLELQSSDPTLLDRLFRTALGQAAFDGDGLTHELTKNLDAIREMQDSAGRPGGPPASGAPRRAFAAADPQAPADAPKARAGLADDPALADAEAKEELLGGALAERRLDLDRRSGESRAFYRAPRPTEQLVEQHYWRVNLPDQTPALVEVNRFWGDYAAAKSDRFVSPHIAEATGSFAEMMLALAVLDLPFKAGEHSTEKLENGVRLVAASPLLLVRKDLVDVAVADDATPILVSQNLFRQDARYRYVGNERLDAFVTDEFVRGVAYGCQVVVTNPTSAPRQLELLLQIPQGALPLQRGFETKGKALRLDPYGTASVEYGFYFPEAGSMPHYPVQISETGRLIAFAEGRNLNVVAQATAIDTDSWAHVSQQGTRAEVLAFLRNANLQRTDLSQIAWRMGDRAFFVATLELLRQRHVFNERLWSYGLRHGDERAVREYLPNASGFVAACGDALESALLTLDPEERRIYQHTEFAPWINQRAHPFGNEWKVTSANISGQYARFMNILCQRPELDDDDWMSVSYYMLLLDRVEDGLAAFAKVDPQRLTTRLQYDYMQAYVSFYSEDYDLARRIAARYVDHPVDRWRHRFRDVIAQLDEAAGAAVLVADPTVDQNALTASEPSLELDVEARRVSLQYRNVAQCQVSYYEMDVEFLFSTRPFVQDESRSFAYIKPHLSETRTLDPEASDLAFDLPEQFRNANVLVEVRAGGVVRRQPYFANSLTVHTLETYGQVQVAHADSGQPLRKVYVKVFARQPNGNFRFYKDGYTDLRGRFDYASIGTSEAIAVDRFAVLVLSEDHGATIREMSPPTQ